MGDFGRSDRGLPVPDTVDEIAAVIAAGVEAGFPGHDPFVDQAAGLGGEAAAIHPDPSAVTDPAGADPLGKLGTVGHRHLDSIGVAADEAKGDGCVVDGTAREFPAALDRDGSGPVEAQAPVGDVGMVTDPVEHLAATPGQNPPPVPVGHAPVGGPGGGAEPAVPVQMGRHLLDRGVLAEGAAGQTDLYCMHFTDTTVVDELGRVVEIVDRALPASGLPDPAVALDRVAHRPAFPQVMREGLFAVDVEARPGGVDRDDRMPVIRRGDRNGIEPGMADQFLEIGIGDAILIAVFEVDDLTGLLEALAVDVADRHDLDIVPAEEAAEIAHPHVAHPDRPEHDAVGGRGCAEDGGRHDGGKDQGGPGPGEGPLEKSPPAESFRSHLGLFPPGHPVHRSHPAR